MARAHTGPQRGSRAGSSRAYSLWLAMLLHTTRQQLRTSTFARTEKNRFDHAFPPPFKSGDLRRLVFCSLSALNYEWKKIPSDVLEEAILCLDCDRKWVFHEFSEGKGSEKQLKHLKVCGISRGA